MTSTEFSALAAKVRIAAKNWPSNLDSETALEFASEAVAEALGGHVEASENVEAYDELMEWTLAAWNTGSLQCAGTPLHYD